MAVVIEELQVDASTPRPVPAAPDAGQGATHAAFDERPVREMLDREATRLARLYAD